MLYTHDEKNKKEVFVLDLTGMLKSLENCPCGKKHTLYTKDIQIGSGITSKTGEILRRNGFEDDLLLVADENTIAAAAGVRESLIAAGFRLTERIYHNLTYARAEQVDELKAICPSVQGIISVGTGSLNDICRVASYQTGKKFCIFATAPSMDGFVSDTAPIVKDSFKSSWQAEQPLVVIADTKILAAAPTELKSAGFGDMVAKYIGLAEWKMAKLLTDEYYCPNVAAITSEAIDRITALADRITENSEEAAGAVMEALVLTGVAMKLAGCSRPASGAEHVVSHYLECYKLNRGIWPEFHGKKVGVMTVILNRAYRNIAERVTEVNPHADNTDWDLVYSKYDACMLDDIKRVNTPTITDIVSPERLKECWGEIRKIMLETLPTDEKLLSLMHAAGAATTPEEVHVGKELLADALRFHPYMRYRLLLTRLLPMLDLDIMDFIK